MKAVSSCIKNDDFGIFTPDLTKSDDVSGGRLRHDWYKKASDMSHHNCYNMFNQSKTYTWEDVFEQVDKS